MAKRNYLALLAILLLAFALRVYRLDGQSLWYDEAVTAQVASQGIGELDALDGRRHPTAVVLLRGGWMAAFGRPGRVGAAFSVGLLRHADRAADVGRRFASVRPGPQRDGWPPWPPRCLTALSPLYVYYAQEARMYTLLTFLGLLAGYALLRATMDDPDPPYGRRANGAENGALRDDGTAPAKGRVSSVKWWLLFVIASAALLYTHYLGVFLLVAYGVCFMIEWLVASGAGQTSLASAGRFCRCRLSIALLYLPWLPAMLNRYAVDRSYWQGALRSTRRCGTWRSASRPVRRRRCWNATRCGCCRGSASR